MFGARPRRAEETLCGFFLQQAALDDIAQVTRSGVVLCPAHLDLAKLDVQVGKSLNAVTRLRTGLRAPGAVPGPVVIDCCALLNVLSLNAIFACDLMLVPVSCDYLALASAREVERALDALTPVFRRRLPRRYVLTRYDARRRMSDDVIAQMTASFAAGGDLRDPHPREREARREPGGTARRVPTRPRQQGRAGLCGAVRGAAAAAGGALIDGAGSPVPSHRGRNAGAIVLEGGVPLISAMTASTSSDSPRGTLAASRLATISHCGYICRNRRSATSRVAATIERLSTRPPLRVMMQKPNRVIVIASTLRLARCARRHPAGGVARRPPVPVRPAHGAPAAQSMIATGQRFSARRAHY